MAETETYHSYEELLELMHQSAEIYDFEIIDKAYNFAKEAHKGQKRKSGIDYILHPVSVAYILVDLGMDTSCIVAALLHDVVEDTKVTRKKIKEMFGSEIARLVDGATKLKQISLATREEQQAENVSKMLLAMLQDIRVIMIKLADRLNNMRTIECMPEKSRIEKSLQNMEVYAPIAHRLGIRTIKDELENISLSYLDPIGYKEASTALSLCTEDAEKFIKEIKEKLYQRISPTIPNVYVEGRIKSINEIYKKIFIKGRSIEQIYDVYAVRVIVDDVKDCYNVFGIVHDMFQPIPKRFKDYISTPKRNMYQSLHTTVLSTEGIPFEIQIRTWDMHRTAEYGITAHWKYKLGNAPTDDKLSGTLSWIRKLIDDYRNSNDMADVIGNIKSDLVPKEIFVLTPRGEVINLPIGSTVVDFAYAIHTELGNRLTGAKVNRKMVPIDHKLKTGEIVEIMSSKDPSKGPGRDWLNFVKTSEARSKIKQWFKKECREENIAKGKSDFEFEMRKNGIDIPDDMLSDFLKPLIKKHQCSDIEDFYAAIGYGGIYLWKMMPQIKSEFSKKFKSDSVFNKSPKPSYEGETKKSSERGSGVIIDNVDGCAFKIAGCCSPLPGDDIVGFITKGYGVTIHRSNCVNLKNNIDNTKEGRCVSAKWAEDIDQIFDVTIEIRTGLDEDSVSKVVKKVFSFKDLKFRSSSLKADVNKKMIVYITLGVENAHQLDKVMSELSKTSGVEYVRRVESKINNF